MSTSMETEVKEELPSQPECTTDLFQGDIKPHGSSDLSRTWSSESSSSCSSSYSPKEAVTSRPGVVRKVEPENPLLSMTPSTERTSDLAASPKVSVHVSDAISGESQGPTDIKKESVTSEYTLEWWYDMGPASPSVKQGRGDIKASPNIKQNRDDMGPASPNLKQGCDDIMGPASPNVKQDRGDIKASPNIKQNHDDMGPASPNIKLNRDDIDPASPSLKQNRDDIDPASPSLKQNRDDIGPASPSLKQNRDDMGPASPSLKHCRDDMGLASPNLKLGHDDIMGPASLNLKRCQDVPGNKDNESTTMAHIPWSKMAKEEDCSSFKVQHGWLEAQPCKKEYIDDEEEDAGVPDVGDDEDARKLEKALDIPLETKSTLDIKMPSTSPGRLGMEEESATQGEAALNLSIPKWKRDEPTPERCQPIKENVAFLNSHKAHAEFYESAYSQNASSSRQKSEARSRHSSSSSSSETADFVSTASTSLLQVSDPRHQTPTSGSFFPWTLGLCRAPIYAHSPMVNFTSPSMHLSTATQMYPAIGNQLSSNVPGLTMSSAFGGRNSLDLVVAPSTRHLESFVTPFSSLSLSNLGAIESAPGSTIRADFQPVATLNDQRQLAQHPGILFLASQSVSLQQFPCLPVTSHRGEQTNQQKAEAVGSRVPNKLPIQRISSYISKERRGPSKSKPHLGQENNASHNVETSDDRQSGEICEKTTCYGSNERPDKGLSDSKTDNLVKNEKTSRKSKYNMETKDFVDPTMIKLSHDDEVSDDNELMTDLIHDGNNSSDEEWIPEANETKVGNQFFKEPEDSSSDEAKKGKSKSRRHREGRGNRSRICRRGRPVSKAVACPTCGKVFHGKYHLNRHEMSHTETRPFECNTCGKKFKQKAHLQGHEMIHKRQRSKPKQKAVKSTGESQEEAVTNKFCGRPKKYYSEKELSCATCQKSFKTLYRLKRHVQSHTDERPYSCRVCGKGFKQTGHRNEHEANHEKNRRKFLCNMCGVIFRCRSSFNNHLKGHSNGDKQPRLPKVTARRSSNAAAVAADPEDGTECDDELSRSGYDCPYCADKFSTAQGLNRHLDSHIEVHQRLHVQPYTCKHCSRSFTYKHNMMKHMLAHLAPEKYALYHQAKLEQHVASGKPCYKCSTCSKMFIRKETLVKHSKIHTGYKPFKCLVCSKEFSQNVHLKVHTRKHTGNRPFQCKRCNRGFIDSTALAKHIEYEACTTENVFYNCKICEKRHYYLGSIKQHIVRQHGESDVEQHIQRVQRQRPKPKKTKKEKSAHTCQVCASTFTEKGNLVRHVRRKHKDLMKMFHDGISTAASSNSSLCSASSSTNNFCREPVSQSSEETRNKPKGFDDSRGNEGFRGEGKEHKTEKRNSPDLVRRAADVKLDSTSAASRELPRGNIRPEGELLWCQETANNGFIPPVSQPQQFTFENNQPAGHSQTAKNFSPSASKLSDISDMLDPHDERDDSDIGQKVSGGIENATTPVRTDVTSTEVYHEPGKNNDRDIQASGGDRENSQDQSAVSFLSQFGLVASDKAKRESGALEKEMPTSWSTERPNQFTCTSLSPASSLGNKGEEETTLKCFVSSKVDEEFGKHSDEGSLTIDLNGQSRQPHSDFELFCNLALMSENGVSSGMKPDNAGSRLFSDAVGDSDYTDLSDGCQSNVHETRGEGKTTLDNQFAQIDLCNNDPSEDPTRRREDVAHSVEQPLAETYAQVRPWLQQLFGKATRLYRRTSRLSTRSSAKRASGSTGQKNVPPKQTASDTHHYVQSDHTRRTSYVPTVVTRSMAHESHSQGQKPLDQEPSFEQEKMRAGETESVVEEEVIVSGETTSPSSFESQGIKDRLGHDPPTNAGDSQSRMDTAADGEFSSLVISLPGTSQHSETTQVQANDVSIHAELTSQSAEGTFQSASHLEQVTDLSLTSKKSSTMPPFIGPTAEITDPPLTSKSSSSKSPFIGPSAEVTNLPLTSKKSSKEATTQTSTPVELLSPGGVPASPLTMAFLLRASEGQLQSSAGIPVPVSGLSSRQATPTARPKESFPCHKCGKCFNARHQLKRHEMTHTEIRPYGCPECGRAFRQKVHLSDHLKRHGGQRPFACQACGKCFVLKNELKQHSKNYCRRAAAPSSADAVTAEAQTTSWKRRQQQMPACSPGGSPQLGGP